MYITKEKFEEICKNHSSLLVLDSDVLEALDFVQELLRAEREALREREPFATKTIERVDQAAYTVFDISGDIENEEFLEVEAISAETKMIQTADELISRKALLDEIQAHFGCGWDQLGQDCRDSWNVISNYSLQDGDLVSRDGLLNAVLDEFGCDLAYYGRDLQFFQDAIVGIPAVSERRLDSLISNAEGQRKELSGISSGRDFEER